MTGALGGSSGFAVVGLVGRFALGWVGFARSYGVGVWRVCDALVRFCEKGGCQRGEDAV